MRPKQDLEPSIKMSSKQRLDSFEELRKRHREDRQAAGFLARHEFSNLSDLIHRSENLQVKVSIALELQFQTKAMELGDWIYQCLREELVKAARQEAERTLKELEEK